MPEADQNLIRGLDPGAGDQEIMAAQEWLLARGEFGTLMFYPGNYPISDSVRIDSQRISIDGNNAKWVSTGFTTEKPMLWLDSTRSLNDSFVGMTKISLLHIYGGNTRDGKEIGIYSHSDTPNASVRVLLDCVKVQGCRKGISIKSRSYFLRGIGVEVFRCKWGLFQEAGAVDFAENVAFQLGTIFNCDCLVRDDGGQRWRFYGTSFDYFGDPSGTRITEDDRIFDLQNGSEVELFGCHLEFNYGDAAGQSNNPIRLQGANTKFSMIDGKIDNHSSQNPFWRHLISTNNASQVVSLNGTQLVTLGRVMNYTNDDALVGGSTSDSNGVCATIVTRNLKATGVDKNDLPSVPAYTYNGQFLRNGVDDPYLELLSRISIIGSATISRVNSENGVLPRNGIGSMLKISGAGKVLISFPIYEPMRRHAWALFLNTFKVVGTVAIRERHSTVVQKWNGATGIDVSEDNRNAYSGLTVTLSSAANVWRRVSWKDTVTNTIQTPRMNNALFAIEIDATNMSGGALYLDDAAFALM